ncbi:GDSL-type esterase/lipase family protein [Morganella morganii]|uniref:DUF459 domain-containing protein n=1 Tax=Morganella morganii TaxID=582 RepID=UPI00202519FD|nr:GDSL-type esterase/lipase family protein [Morganella morganii]UUC09335.1 hypothetical protein [Morganella morganii]
MRQITVIKTHNLILALIFFIITLPVTGQCKPLFIGDSLTYELAVSYKNRAPVDARFLESTGLQSVKLLDWQNYIQEMNFRKYDTIYVVLGTNDLISERELNDYHKKARQFIRVIKKQNNNIVWLLPPTLENNRKNQMLDNTRAAIISAAAKEGIRTLDMRSALGEHYVSSLNGVRIRTNDGIHITSQGANSVINMFN